MFTQRQLSALAKAGVSASKVQRAKDALLPQPAKLSKDMIRRIEIVRDQCGTAIVCDKQVMTPVGYAARVKGAKNRAAQLAAARGMKLKKK